MTSVMGSTYRGQIEEEQWLAAAAPPPPAGQTTWRWAPTCQTSRPSRQPEAQFISCTCHPEAVSTCAGPQMRSKPSPMKGRRYVAFPITKSIKRHSHSCKFASDSQCSSLTRPHLEQGMLGNNEGEKFPGLRSSANIVHESLPDVLL
eukprot:624082-Hanusia_phi.AAC.7